MSTSERNPFLQENQEFQDHEVSTLDSCLQDRWTTSPSFHGKGFWFMTHAIVCIATSLIWVAWIWSKASIPPALRHAGDRALGGLATDVSVNFTANAKLLTCGHSTAEAKSLGCKYDILSNHWVPGICLDEEAIKEYQSDGSWYGYTDRNRTELIDYGAMGDHSVYYTSMRDHIVHCSELWKKQFRAFYVERQNIDTIIGSYGHTMHCAQFLTDMTNNGPDYWNMPIQVEVAWAGCWIRQEEHLAHTSQVVLGGNGAY